MNANRLLRYENSTQKAKEQICNWVPFLRGYDYNLSISHSHRFIWFRVAKVGTRTLLDKFDKEDVSLLSLNQRLIQYPSEKYNDYFKFAIVRNPWDRLVSCWQNKIVDSNLFNLEPELRAQLQVFCNFIKYIETLDLKKTDIHIRLQTELIDVDNIDFIGRFETFEADAKSILKHLNINAASIEKRNSSNRTADTYRSYYTDSTQETVAKLFAADIATFNYCF